MKKEYLQITTDNLDEVFFLDIRNIFYCILVQSSSFLDYHLVCLTNLIEVHESSSFYLEVSEKCLGFLIRLECDGYNSGFHHLRSRFDNMAPCNTNSPSIDDNVFVRELDQMFLDNSFFIYIDNRSVICKDDIFS